MKPCKFCGSEGECFLNCQCMKCRNPEAYEKWRNQCKGAYNDWLEWQFDEEDFNA